jgi:hypothetical protein
MNAERCAEVTRDTAVIRRLDQLQSWGLTDRLLAVENSFIGMQNYQQVR